MPSYRLLAITTFLTSNLLLATRPLPYLVGPNGKPVFPNVRSLCGPDDMTKMVEADVDLQKMGKPIGILSVDMGGLTGYCTGTLIGKDLFLTAAHCEGACNTINVSFNFLKENRQETFACKEIVEKGDSSYENDYMVLRLEGNPGVEWGWYKVAPRQLPKDHPLLMIHHPQAMPMRISRNCPVYEQDENYISHRCDTQPGSSGSGILDPDFKNPENTRIIAVHTLGGCNDSETSSNSGPSMKHLVTVSPLLKQLAAE